MLLLIHIVVCIIVNINCGSVVAPFVVGVVVVGVVGVIDFYVAVVHVEDANAIL